MQSLRQHDLGIGTVARTNLTALGRANGSLDLKLIGTIVFHRLWGDVLQVGVELQVLQGTDGYLHRHARNQAAHLGLVDVATEDEVVHVCHAGDGGSVVEGVGENHGVTHLHRDVEDDARDGGADEGGRGTGVALRYAVAHHLEVVFGGNHFFSCLLQGLLHLVELVGAYQLLLEELFLAPIVYLCLLQVDASQAHTSLRRTELSHVWDYLYLGNHLASLNVIARLLANLGDDTANLWLHAHLVARFDFTRDDGGLQYICHLGSQLGVFHRLRL